MYSSTGQPVPPVQPMSPAGPHRSMTLPAHAFAPHTLGAASHTFGAAPHTLAPEIPGLPPGPALLPVEPGSQGISRTTSRTTGMGLSRVASNQALNAALAASGQPHLMLGRSSTISGAGDMTPRGGGWAAWQGVTGSTPPYPYSGAATPRQYTYPTTGAASAVASPGGGGYMLPGALGLGPMLVSGMGEPHGALGGIGGAWEGVGMEPRSGVRSGMMTPGGGDGGGVPLAGLAPTRLHENLRLLQVRGWVLCTVATFFMVQSSPLHS